MPYGSTWPDVGQDAPAGLAASSRDRQAGYTARLRTAGLAQIAVWVPASHAAHIHAEAVRLRLEAGLPLPAECDRAQLRLPLDAPPGAAP